MLIASIIHESLLLLSRRNLWNPEGQTCLSLGLSQSSQMGTGKVPRGSERQAAYELEVEDINIHFITILVVLELFQLTFVPVCFLI